MSQLDSCVPEAKLRIYKWKHAIHYHNGQQSEAGTGWGGEWTTGQGEGANRAGGPGRERGGPGGSEAGRPGGGEGGRTVPVAIATGQNRRSGGCIAGRRTRGLQRWGLARLQQGEAGGAFLGDLVGV